MFLFIDSITSCLIACFYLCYGSSRSNSQTGSFHSSITSWHSSRPNHSVAPKFSFTEKFRSFLWPNRPPWRASRLHGSPYSAPAYCFVAIHTRRYICLQMSSRSEEGTGVTGNGRVRTTWCRCWRLRASIRALRTPQLLLHMHPLVYELALYSPTPHACPSSPCPALSSTGHVSHTMKWLKF